MANAKLLDEYFTRPELAAELGKSERTLERWERLKIGPPVTRCGVTPLYNIEGSRAWLRAQEQTEIEQIQGTEVPTGGNETLVQPRRC